MLLKLLSKKAPFIIKLYLSEVDIELYNCVSLYKAVPSRITWRRPLMVRQPYSVAVLSTGGRLHPLVPEEREAW